MSTTAAPVAPTPTPVTAGTAPPAQEEEEEVKTQKWELGVSLILHEWKALSDAVASQWGGAESEDKRGFLCGYLADVFADRPETDEYDIEDMLVGYMEDEFAVVVDDDSAFPVAARIMALRRDVAQGNLDTVDALHARFLARPKGQGAPPAVEEVDQDAGSSASDESDDEDVEMGGMSTSTPAPPRERPEPIVDEDGFELVQKRGGRKR